ncbi:hypothetical protein QTP70_019405, partial [Hemibagrus guttatus]
SEPSDVYTVAVQVDQFDSTQIALVLDNCWATPINQMDYSIHWDLIINKYNHFNILCNTPTTPNKEVHIYVYPFIVTQSHSMDNLEMPTNIQCMSLDRGRKPPRHGENMQTPHTTWQRRETNRQPWRCEANVLTTKPPCPP